MAADHNGTIIILEEKRISAKVDIEWEKVNIYLI